ncbi:AraC family transcriptional regulator [Streptomyces sp. NBC_01485]|uniref:AraC family transcriptional regulator n=1 Tax=Streptomyces sp. NBC_01485 TaxID=2903884 RepID=UPI002E311E8C|nr:AraC family transcriptional regulator [Streptomyces sp. NBC_01485]
MLHESVFRTTDLPVDARFEAWAERMSGTHAPMRLTSDRTADYRGHQRVIGLGDVTVWPATFDQLVFHRTPKLVRQSDPETYHLSLLLKGEGAADWGRQQAAYRINDFHINSSSQSWEVHTGSDPVTVVGIEVPRALVAVPGNRADQVLGSLISGREGIGALLAQFLLQLVADTSAHQPADAPRLGTVVADLVTALFAHAVDAGPQVPQETRGRTLTLQVKTFIRRHLGDPDLTPAGIAAAHHISRSYLYRLFQAEGLAVASYIRDQRLEHARRDLADPRLRALPIHAVAARRGFPRAAEFTRAFRTAYGLPPSEVREQSLTEGQGVRGA